MDPTTLVALAQKALGNKTWNVEMVLRIGAELLSFVNCIPNLSFQNKSDLVCQTILKMLDDAEKVERVLKGESTEKEKTIYYLEECKKVAMVALPVSLELLAASGAVKSMQPAQSVKLSHCLPFSCFSAIAKEATETVTAIQDSLKHPQEYLEEMRDLVSKVEKIFSDMNSSAVVEISHSTALTHAPLPPSPSPEAQNSVLEPPSPELPAEPLPGESVNQVEVELSQQ